MLGLESVDIEERIDFSRLRRERLERLQAAMRKDGIGALLLYDPDNIRYTTSTHLWPAFTAKTFFRYTIVPKEGDPILFELPGVEFTRRKMYTPWVSKNMKPSICPQFAGPAEEAMLQKWVDDIAKTLRDWGLADEKLGIDRLHLKMYNHLTKKGMEVIDAWNTIYDATAVKTEGEIELLKQTATIVDSAFDRVKENIRPGVKERELAAIAIKELISGGCEYIETVIVSSNTNPYLRETTDKPLRVNDLLVVDINVCGPNGYHNDYTRTFLCGSKATEEQKGLYKQCYDELCDVIRKIRAGVSTSDVAESLPLSEDDEYKTLSLMDFGHGIGIHHYEPPMISRAYSLDYPMRLEENMFLAMETYVGRPGERYGVRLEENLIVTETGCEVFSLYPHDEKLVT